MKRNAHRGAALLAAMLTVTMVATFAAAALWQQWRSVEVEAADRTRVQSSWILNGALDWARLILREDFNADRTDYLSEPWAVPLQEARLSTFLAADQNNNMDAAASDADNVFLSGEISDLQAKLNLSCLVQAGSVQVKWVESFQRLFDVLGLPQAQLTRLTENLRFAADLNVENRNASRAALQPQRMEQLTWLGVQPEVIAALEPYVTILPSASTQVNLNTAPAEAIYAVGRNMSLADAKRMVAERDRQPFRSVADASKAIPTATFDLTASSVDTQWFEVRGRLRVDQVVIEERSVVQRTGRNVKVIQRERGSFQQVAQAPR
ncbi:type II secretion system minor pseudopilin GspK [Ramlibacter sp. USB13]|uniref:Type II secretion system protein K n=1 Tax=Ramlibacter cellulosilyticus TaxID=2764187 RepID=A0A923MSJ9_9BURK|nr:type II secretion system minor pseudopilin GspK [Ramlibacter cellulosilyticus]MBC5785042.1 type II secretion system minor pseudopilin GspK [Ramlibacter cellulosilyticus]